MNILVSNDDGINAEGLQILVKTLRGAGHNVFTFAPNKNRSAISNGITMTSPLEISSAGEKSWACSGTPADCVLVAFNSKLIDCKIDAIFAGINDGANLGTDIIYSGTCAVARQGALYRTPSIAFSIDFSNIHNDNTHKKTECFTKMAEFAVKNATGLVNLAKKTECRAFINVNAFALEEGVENWQGARISSSLSIRHYYDDGMDISSNDDGTMKADFVGNPPVTEKIEKSDFALCRQGFISISCVQVEPNIYEVIDDIEFSV